MSFLGLGSVSDYCSHHLKCPVLVAKFAVTEQEQAKEGEQPSGEEAEEAPAPEPAASDGVQQTQQQVCFRFFTHQHWPEHIIANQTPHPSSRTVKSNMGISKMEI